MNLLTALMNRHGIDKEDALEMLFEMKERVNDGEDPEEVLYEEGLEPDYIFDLLEL